ncbi:hypothetical protein BT93_C0276 [Corymbia citriodora subsp. variegata]|nr:hypothetical protein BT93_C0276 [Corymbia citriodora subsp. variegata]
MGMGFRLNLKCVVPVQSHLLSSSPTRLSSSVRGKEASFSSGRLSSLSSIADEVEPCHKYHSRSCRCSSASTPTLEDDLSKMTNTRVTIGKRPFSSINSDTGGIHISHRASNSKGNTSSQSVKAAHFSLLMENLNALEETLADSHALNLERDILQQLGRLGALKLFHTCLSKAFDAPDACEVSDAVVEKKMISKRNNDVKRIIRSGKRETRKSRRERKSAKPNQNSPFSLLSIANQKWLRQPSVSSRRRASNSKRRRSIIARNEAEMSRGVKVVAELERIRTMLEEESGQVPSLRSWAEAAGVDENVLRQNLHFGWFCRDELLRSTRSLVIFLTRNYRGLGIAHEDLIQAGNMGVLRGAERFDHTRGYRFSTYVQYWIRKSMSRMVAWHARGIRIPTTLATAVNQIQKARKSLNNHHRKYPDDMEIAKLTGFSVAKVRSAGQCLRVVGSIDQKVGDFISAKYMEFTPDRSLRSPEETVLRQNMRSQLQELLSGLDFRERQVLILRYGLKDNQVKSLEEIGRLFNVSKEWIRRIERKAMEKLRDKEVYTSLSHYRNI